MEELNLDILKDKRVRFISMEEALKDAVPFDVPAEVLSGEKKIIISDLYEVPGDDTILGFKYHIE